MSSDLPASGDPGVRPPVPGSLPRPVMWPPGAEGTPFDGAEEDTATPPSPRRRKVAYAGVGLMVVAVIVLGLGVALTSWPLLAVGLVVGGVGAALAWRAGIMEDVSISDSPHAG